MKLRYEPIKHLTNNRVQLCEAAYFVFADDERSTLPLGILYDAERHTLNVYGTPYSRWNFLLYTTPDQAYAANATFRVGFDHKDKAQELFEGTREDMQDCLKTMLFEEGLRQWDEKYKDCAHSEYILVRGHRGYTPFGFALGATYPRERVGQITHTGNRQYMVEIFWQREIFGQRKRLVAREGISLKEARAYAKSLRSREVYAEEVADISLGKILDYMYVHAVLDPECH